MCIDHLRMWICDNNPTDCVLSLRPLVLRVFRVICDPPANPRTEPLRLGRATGAWPRLREVSPTAGLPYSCWQGWPWFKLLFRDLNTKATSLNQLHSLHSLRRSPRLSSPFGSLGTTWQGLEMRKEPKHQVDRQGKRRWPRKRPMRGQTHPVQHHQVSGFILLLICEIICLIIWG